MITDILDLGASHYSPDQTTAGAIAKIVFNRLTYIQNLPSTSVDNRQKEMAFLYGEYATWSLLDSIQRSSSPLQKSSNIRNWINNMPSDQHIPVAILKDDMEEEVEAEIEAMLNFSITTPVSSTNNTSTNHLKRMIHFDDDTDDDDDAHVNNLPINATQRRRTTQDDQIKMEKTNESLYNHLRKNDLDGAVRFSTNNSEPWFAAIIKAYVQQCKKIQQGDSIELEAEQQKIWRKSSENRLKKGTSGPYSEAIYGILVGDIDLILPVCGTWEDVIWAYYTTRMELTLDKMAESCNITDAITVLDEAHGDIANRKDISLPRKHPAHFFHLVQAHILNQDFEQLFQLTHKNPDDGSYYKAFIVRNDTDIRHQVDRFMAAFAVYARRYLDAPLADLNTDQIIYHYAKRNQILAFYASQINSELEIDLFAQFLIGFEGDSQERRLLIDLALQYKLHIASILRRTFNLALKRPTSQETQEATMERHTDYSDDHGFGIFELDGPIPDQISKFHQALEWLLMDESVYGDAIKEINNMVRQYLGGRKIYLAENMIESLPVEVIDTCLLHTQGGFQLPNYLDEFQDHALLLECWKLFSSWKTLQKETPDGTLDKLEALKRTLAWERDLLELTEKLENRLLGFLNSSWMKDDDGSVTDGSNDALRQIYISEAVLRLHHIQYCTKDLSDR
ncbi:107-domain-containing protein [Chlamydoabsidia padenii]|nr:107-domain-containing protein [Chlamydoabsidia padenii]